MFIDGGNDMGGIFRTVNTPDSTSPGTPGTPNRQPPLLGEHNSDILCSIGGLSDAELAELATEGKV